MYSIGFHVAAGFLRRFQLNSSHKDHLKPPVEADFWRFEKKNKKIKKCIEAKAPLNTSKAPRPRKPARGAGVAF